ncbi:hypothetical protein [Nocardioides bizhenqiangii]|uniref:GerMN domain-containing protein n=1 Tax=Nocardioides bizhenqiangii TaxID=3095076 RepID=A0ABZ0ZV28_9ACTN|nr:hypothetical protein [Nocardioides sp. HM61]WQQ27674.1 hypothetical protein SHK19_05415 [Nocardioides sp. HM61]
MTPSRAAASAATLAVLAAGLLACGGDDGDPSSATSPDLEPSSEATGSTEPTTSAPKGPKPIPTSYPDVGLEYDGLPDLKGSYRVALEVFVAFDRGRLQLAREAKMNPLVSENAAEQVVATFQSTATYLQDHDAYYRGTSVATFDDVETNGGLLGLDLCLDGTELRFVEGGSASAPDGPARVPFRVIVTQIDGSWTVTEAATQEGTC